jgi:uncharacterized protein (DUF1778 family)
LNKKLRKPADTKLTFKLDSDLKQQIENAALFLDLSVSQLLRRGAVSFIHLHAPEVLTKEERLQVSVIEPESLPDYALEFINQGRR